MLKNASLINASYKFKLQILRKDDENDEKLGIKNIGYCCFIIFARWKIGCKFQVSNELI